jgi:citrate synthase
MDDLHWKTAITDVKPNSIALRGFPLDKLMGQITFSQAIYLVLKGEMPTPEVGRLIDAIFVSSVDHGGSPPSVLAARTVKSTGAELNSSIAAGVLAISRYHGGAIEEGMRLFKEIAGRMDEKGLDKDQATGEVLLEMKEKKKRASGFGHRLHTKDPRTIRLFGLAEELGLAGQYIQIALSVEKALVEISGRALPINVDGAIAAVLCDLDISPEIGNAFFIIARVPGLVAHIQEESTRMKPMRKIHPQDFEYDGPKERDI